MSRRIIRIDRTLLFKILSFSLSAVCILVISDVIVGHFPQELIPDIHARRSIVYSPELGIVTNKPNSTIVYLDLNDALLEYRKIGLRCEDIHIPWDGHWTPVGHRLAAESIHRMLKSSRLIP